jgi:hypothetical protein
VEEEFFFQGTATSYATPALADGVALSTGLPYKSRMIVRRPADPSQFNAPFTTCRLHGAWAIGMAAAVWTGAVTGALDFD